MFYVSASFSLMHVVHFTVYIFIKRRDQTSLLYSFFRNVIYMNTTSKYMHTFYYTRNALNRHCKWAISQYSWTRFWSQNRGKISWLRSLVDQFLVAMMKQGVGDWGRIGARLGRWEDSNFMQTLNANHVLIITVSSVGLLAKNTNFSLN